MVATARSADVDSLKATAREIRQDVIRMTYAAGGGAPGGSLAATDLLTALIFHELRLDPAHPDAPDRDRLVLSNGPAVPALYAALARRGFLPVEELRTFRLFGSRLQGQVDRKRLPGIEASTGGPGQGVGIAVGVALDQRLRGGAARVFALLGDGECRAGSTWEALMAGGQYALDQLTVVLDRSRYGSDGDTEATMGLEPIADKFRAFRYETIEIDGHDFGGILGALAHARATRGRPTAILARTVTGKGVSFMENKSAYRGRGPGKDEAERALRELGGVLTA